jgi:hypothetical protein
VDVQRATCGAARAQKVGSAQFERKGAQRELDRIELSAGDLGGTIYADTEGRVVRVESGGWVATLDGWEIQSPGEAAPAEPAAASEPGPAPPSEPEEATVEPVAPAPKSSDDELNRILDGE